SVSTDGNFAAGPYCGGKQRTFQLRRQADDLRKAKGKRRNRFTTRSACSSSFELRHPAFSFAFRLFFLSSGLLLHEFLSFFPIGLSLCAAHSQGRHCPASIGQRERFSEIETVQMPVEKSCVE